LLFGCSIVAWLLAARLQRIISEPISGLANTAIRIAEGRNYDVRAVKHTNDEIGVLIDGFNAMLAQIQARDAKLQRAHDDLELRVADRTHELQEAQQAATREHAKFKFIFDAVPVGISLVVPGEDATRLVNPAHERITGVSAAESGRKGAFAHVTHPDDYARQQVLVGKFVRGEIDHYNVENRYVRPDGPTTWAVLTSRMFVDSATGRRQAVTTLVDITDRKQAETELATTHQRLLEVSRRAGMAEVATGVLHNVGNVLNSVNVSATLVADHVRESKAANLAKVAALFREHEAGLAAFLTTDPRGRQVPGYLAALADHVAGEQELVLEEIEGLRKNIEHIRDIVAMQQSYAKFSGLAETIGLVDLVEDALRMNVSALARHQVELIRDFRARPVLDVEKHKVLQILINVIRNAKYACDESGRSDKQIIVRLEEDAGSVSIAVIDNGVGISAENLTRIFGHGFTTRKDGHGFGLHSGALAAKELRGELTVQSDGLGRGATFTLRLPKASTHPAA
jgi:PAS domain S-box-containing protein